VVTQFKVQGRNCGKIGHKAAQCKAKKMREDRNEVICNDNEGLYKYNYFRGNNGRERQCNDREKGWQVTMWNPIEK
jgi:hypothetical protein